MESLASCLSTFTSASEAWRGAPFSVKSGRSVWSAASDGNWLVFVKKDLGFPPVDTGYKDRVLKYLHFSPEKTLRVDLTYLKEWAGPVPDTRDFDIEDQRRGIFFRVVVNLKRLACLLEPFTVQSFTLWDAEGTGVRAIGLEGDDWRIILGGLDRDPDEPVEEDEVPIPIFEVKQKSAFDLAMARLEED